jgi:hypothetical protein
MNYVLRQISPCTLEADRLNNGLPYGRYFAACSESGGVWYAYRVSVFCLRMNYNFSSYPTCLVHQNDEAACNPGVYERYLESLYTDNVCSATATRDTTERDVAPISPTESPVHSPAAAEPNVPDALSPVSETVLV